MGLQYLICVLASTLMILAGPSLTLDYRIATAADAVPSPMKADLKFPQLSQVIMAVKEFSPELVAYVENPKTVCTLIAPDNEAMTTAMNALGEYVGLVLQNQTLQQKILNYHVIPGQKVKAQDLGTRFKSIQTREGEPLYFVQHRSVPYVAFGRKYVQPIEIANIPAGGCLVHIVNQTLMAPPSLVPLFEDWLKKAGNATALQAPEPLWLPAPLPTSKTPSSSANTTGTDQHGTTAKTLDSSSGAATGAMSPSPGSSQPVNSGFLHMKASIIQCAVTAAVAVLIIAL